MGLTIKEIIKLVDHLEMKLVAGEVGTDCRQEPLGGNCDGISRNDISLDLGG